jgi:UDP-glucose 4-epimerase
MKVLVTGGAGYIGSVTAERLLDQGHDVVVFDNLENGHRSAVDSRAELIVGDLRDQGAITDAVARCNPEAVVHFAAYALVGESCEKPELYFRNNVVGTINLLEAMLGAGVTRFVFSSTCATYGDPDTIPIDETCPQLPTNPYGESKLMIENVLKWYIRYRGFRGVCLRYFNAAGATQRLGEDHDPESHLIPLVLRVALGQSEQITVLGNDYPTPDGTCVRDYIHIGDLAEAHILALGHEESGIYNLGIGKGYSVREVIDVARSISGSDIPAVAGERRAGDPPALIANGSRAREVLGWSPQFERLEDIVQSAWDWHREHPDGYAD